MKITNDIKQEIIRHLEFHDTLEKFISVMRSLTEDNVPPAVTPKPSLESLAETLRKKNSDIRLNVKALMNEWAIKSECGEEIISSIFFWNGKTYHLCTGRSFVVDEDMNDFCETRWFSDEVDMDTLRAFVINFDRAVESIQNKMESKLEFKYTITVK